MCEPRFDGLHKMLGCKFGREVCEVFSLLASIAYEEFLELTGSVLPGLAEEFTLARPELLALPLSFTPFNKF